MATEAPEFTDILSAALDESGITGDDFDFDFGFPAPTATQNVPLQQPQLGVQQVPRTAIQPPVQNVARNPTTPIQNVPRTPTALIQNVVRTPTAPIQNVVRTPTAFIQNVTRTPTAAIQNVPPQMIMTGDTRKLIGQPDVFSQALKDLAGAGNSGHPLGRIVATAGSITTASPMTLHSRTLSSPTIITLPGNMNQNSIVSQIPQILRQHSAASSNGGSTPTRPKIITVKRMGANGSIAQSRSFKLAGNTEGPVGPVTPTQKIIVRSASGAQSPVLRTGSPISVVTTQNIGSEATGTIKLPTNLFQPKQNIQMSQPVTLPSGISSANIVRFQDQFKTFTQNRVGDKQAMTNTNSVVGLQPIMESDQRVIIPQRNNNVRQSFNPINMINANPSQRLVTQPTNVPARVVTNHSSIHSTVTTASPTIRVIRRPFMNDDTSQGRPLSHSQSMPTHLSNFASIPPHVLDKNRASPPSVFQGVPSLLPGSRMTQPGVATGVATAANGFVTSVSSLSAMQRTLNSLPVTNLSSRDVSRMWSNQDVRLKNFSPHLVGQQHAPVVPTLVEEEEEGEEVEGLGQAETYSDYIPMKSKIGIKHPDSVVETSSMSSIEPPDITYRISIPESIIDYGELSALQLESIVYASQRHDLVLPSGERGGFLIGDGAGVGKGRTVAGIIYENYILGRKRSLWLSVSNDLRLDAERDLRDIGASKIDVHSLNKFKYAKISSKVNGSVKKGIIFATYSSLIGESHSSGKYKTRLKQLLKWFGKDFDGVIIFDECHKAKNLCPTGSSKPTKTGLTVLELQKRLPKARVVYASATGATEPRNMAYMTRLGVWGPGTAFPEFMDFIQAVEKRGVGAMELVAMDMKLRGMYIARQLSFQGVSFHIEEIPIDKEFIKMYNEAVGLWVDAREMFQAASELVDTEHRMKKSMWGQFWSAHQRFFKYLCISSKVPHCVRLAREAIRDGKCVVIGLQSTGEARTLEQLEEMGGELNDFVSTAKGVFQTVVEKHFPAPDRKKFSFFDILGINKDEFNEDSNSSTPGSNKRKKDQMYGSSTKRARSSDSSSESEESDFDFGLSDLSETDDDSGSENDNFNPFGAGSDSDDDPWLKKQKSSKSKSKTKVVKEKKKKEKKKKKHKSMDDEFDRALAKSGLLQKEQPPAFVNGGDSNSSHKATGDAMEKAYKMKKELLERLELLADKLPPNTLDQLIDDLGGTDSVAEMTGRKGRVVCTDEGISYESRSENDVPLEFLNLTEKQRFMDGEKNIAIISEAASSGISLQADRRALNQRRRVHITLELPWSADRAIQQFGRTHRSNQVSAPEYLFLISDLAGEQRFASTVAKRLESLGALTHGDRRATETRDLSRFNFDNKFGRTALESVMKSVCGFEGNFVPTPAYDKGDFFMDSKRGLVGVGIVIQERPDAVPMLEKDYNNISKFLNRILGMEVALQNALFKYFSDTLTAIILEAKRSGRWDMGILDLGSGGESVKKLETKIFVGNTATNTAKTELTTVSVERGMSFPSALDIWHKYSGVDDGFYLSTQERQVRKFAIVAAYQGAYNKKKEKLYTIYRPNTGLQPRQETLAEVKKKYRKVLPEEAQRFWEEQYNSSATMCSHHFWRGSCKKASLGLSCEIGLRTRTYYVLSGSVLSVWNKVESVLASMLAGVQSRMQIIRLRTDDNQRIVGSLIPTNCVEHLTSVLSQDCSKTYTEKHAENRRPAPKEESQAVETLSMPVFF